MRIPAYIFITLSIVVKKEVTTFNPPSKEDHLLGMEIMKQQVEPLRKNLTECAREVQASSEDVDRFLRRSSQETMPGKCLVACILRRNGLLKKNIIQKESLIEANAAVFGEGSAIVERLKTAVQECAESVDGIFEICAMASTFNDCMHWRVEKVLDKALLERKMATSGEYDYDLDYEEDDLDVEDEEVNQIMKDEL